MSSQVFIAIGSNLGNREQNLMVAVERLQADESIQVVRASSIYETDPVGYEDQGPFLNMVIEVATSYHPLELLEMTQDIELVLGREREIVNGPRTVDLDLLLYEGVRLDVDDLQIPHPRMWDRAFVLVPLAEIAPKIKSEKSGLPLSEVINKQFNDKEGVRWWKQWNGVGTYEPIES
ncbi:2-amino-4-hydroxy-6-hydroxymethyldihydropteridine diphosphokinase [Shouchella lehensis]|uniref:2-amino-4-hydroxy-6-hydroxymethyldihydropteridine diphosphokinase n=2 Tax=Shouchella lehensis TaxID=300825 RepID=A0A060LZI1_9BACI|nr:2-amino-4-hydroxy-6-hydroxymethyldihydropteridine diphosphokinase [Shouchella lehensis]AIC96636.1 7,8-dihydro-6-hydroxymethylpterin- pyrophosphokinase [Shouchella lehensis G1]MBG9782361.1 2-amino-4-hydroxy-6-hydroxymethyldihydropteridine pyrophosphokinase [Shouchella lehensis]RQW18124.1 2-amino-4-hydroxy-6-hydroxymethyldihydropteridine diphosphokinase [Bacillus sp. C1-1]TES46902.1 2-amino-4-hydroxy-6-hydroxymethyldihydropteridine diphosphokinase [Shouchella lehensis]